MKKVYIIALLLILVLIVNNGVKLNSNNNSNHNSNNIMDDVPLVNKELLTEEEIEKKSEDNVIFSFFNKIFSTLREYVSEDIIPTTEKSKIKIIKGQNISVDYSNLNLKNDIVSPNPIDSTEYRFVEENPKVPYSTINVSQHPSYYKSDFEDELTKTGEFFDENMMYNDKTSPYSKTILPDRCFMDKNNEIICDYNNKLQLIPPKLINEPNNKVIKSIGQGKGDIFKSVEGKNIESINGNYYQSWDYENEKLINGGNFYGSVSASDPDNNEGYLLLENIVDRPNYSL